jgi:hypothetical protein
VRDASRGGAPDKDAVALAPRKLAELDSELKVRGQLAQGPQAEFATAMHGKTDAELKTEAARQRERYTEATTGLAQDPAAAKDAQEKLQVLMREQVRRLGSHFAGNLPIDPPTRPITDRTLATFGQEQRQASNEELQATKTALERAVRDAETGAHVDPVVAENARKQLEVVKHEEAARAAISRGPQPEYALGVHQKSDFSNMIELARQKERLKDATTGLFQDPAAAKDAQEKIRVLEAEHARRHPLDLNILRRVGAPVMG